MDLYKILGLEKNATKDEIKKAYRILSLKYHPDKNQMNDTTLRFQSISDSYSILYDDNKRKEYDKRRIFENGHYDREHDVSYPPPHPPHSNFNRQSRRGGYAHCSVDPYNSIYTQQPPRSSLQLTIVKELCVTIEQSYNGCDVPIEIVRWIYQDNLKKEEKETLYVSIQRGIDDNEVIELKNKGNILNDHTKGDLKIFIKIKNDSIFTRNGLDLHVKHNVTLKEALCGFSFNMTFINNKLFKINNGPGNIVIPGFKKIINDMGMVRGEKTGNLLIEFSVEFPTQLTCEQIDEIRRVL